MKTPTIHTNGTSKRALLEQVTDAVATGIQFQVALQVLAQRNDATRTLRDGHDNRELTVQGILSELSQLAQHIDPEFAIDTRFAAIHRFAPSLFGQFAQVRIAGVKFRNALQEMAPHGRDYYPQGDDAVRQATAEHDRRLRAVRQILDELDQIFDNRETIESALRSALGAS